MATCHRNRLALLRVVRAPVPPTGGGTGATAWFLLGSRLSRADSEPRSPAPPSLQRLGRGLAAVHRLGERGAQRALRRRAPVLGGLQRSVTPHFICSAKPFRPGFSLKRGRVVEQRRAGGSSDTGYLSVPGPAAPCSPAPTGTRSTSRRRRCSCWPTASPARRRRSSSRSRLPEARSAAVRVAHLPVDLRERPRASSPANQAPAMYMPILPLAKARGRPRSWRPTGPEREYL